jgi:cytochrome c556
MNRSPSLIAGVVALTAASIVLAAQAKTPAKPLKPLPENTANLTIKDIMDSRVDPAGDYLFESVVESSDAKGLHHKQPHTARQWAEVRHQLQVLIDAPNLLTAPGRKAAHPEDRSRNAAVENEPEQIQRLMDSQHADFVVRAGRLRDAAKVGMTAAEARNPKALFKAISGIDKACESCHLHYWYPNDKRAHQAALEEGGIIP